jgi:hypothetical protein
MKNLNFPKSLMPAGIVISKPEDAMRNWFTQLTTILIFICLFANTTAVSAQSQQGIFNLKPGDWFEMEVTYGTKGEKSSVNDSCEMTFDGVNFKKSIKHHTDDLKFELIKQLLNGNQIYMITLMRKRYLLVDRDRYFGFDTFYPPFYDQKPVADRKNQYTIEVTPIGDVINFEPNLNNSFKEMVNIELSARPSLNAIITHTQTILDEAFEVFAQDIFQSQSNSKQGPDAENAKVGQPDIAAKPILYEDVSRLPLLISKKKTQYLLTDASFSISGNSIIKGVLKNGAGEIFKVSKGDSCELTQNGTFSLPILLTRPTLLNLKLGNREVNAFMLPGDTLEIKADQLNQSVPIQFSGSAANNTRFSNELAQLEINIWDGLEVYFNSREKYTNVVAEIFKKYQGIASETCLDYHKFESAYYLASTKLNCIGIIMWGDAAQSMSFLRNLPSSFFEEVDTLQVLLNPFHQGSYFNNYLREATSMQFYRLMMSNGSKYGFYDRYALIRSSLSGYPFYSQAYDLIREELLNYRNMERIEPYYMDFINNCNDPKMVEPLKDVFEKNKSVDVGNKFLLKSVLLADGTTFDLTKFKGKPVCLVFIESNLASHVSGFKDDIAKFKTGEVEFVFAVMPNNHINSYSRIDTANVTYIDLADNNIKSMFAFEGNRIFVLDKWFRIVDNNVEDLTKSSYWPGSVSRFEQSIRKAIEARRYTKAEEAALYKIAGWSFGSILFTILIGMWVYNIRIRSIKKQEAIKRRIKELEVKAIRSQMNPHFIFNALNSIQSLINGNQFKEANIYLSKFAVLLRGVLNNSEKSMVTLSDELQAVELYCQLEQLRFEFQFAIGIAPEVNPNLIEIPGMVIQPLAENAIVHGLSPIRGHGELNIQIDRLNGNLCICVSDNGAGLQLNKPDHLSEKGFGLKLVEERIKIIVVR